jgi:hypothetical protein
MSHESLSPIGTTSGAGDGVTGDSLPPGHQGTKKTRSHLCETSLPAGLPSGRQAGGVALCLSGEYGKMDPATAATKRKGEEETKSKGHRAKSRKQGISPVSP